MAVTLMNIIRPHERNVYGHLLVWHRMSNRGLPKESEHMSSEIVGDGEIIQWNECSDIRDSWEYERET
jgi:hypothetical protein